jgi:hypothetical protein
MTETNEEKRTRAQQRLLQPDAASLSDRAIAAELGVSQPFISALRNAMGLRQGSDNAVSGDNGHEPSDNEAPEPTETGAAGRGGSQSVQEAARAANLRLVGGDLEDEERVLYGRLEALTAQRLEVTERVVRGLATRDELTVLTVQVQDTERALDDVRALQRAAAKLAREQALAEEVRDFYETVDAVALQFDEACAAAERIDGLLEQLGAAVVECRTACEHWRVIGGLARDFNNLRLVNELSALARFEQLEMFIDRRLVGIGVRVDPSLPKNQTQQTLAPLMRDWTSRLLEHARRSGPRMPSQEAQ